MERILSYYFKDVQRFHNKFGLITPPAFTNLAPDLLEFRVKFLNEEFQEYVDSCTKNDLAIAIDSLIDLVYITCGTAIYHGITYEDWKRAIVDEDDLLDLVNKLFVSSEIEPIRLKPTFLTPTTNVEFTKHLHNLICEYNDVASTALDYSAIMKDESELSFELEIKRILASIYVSVLDSVAAMGITPECWNEFWDDVQRANMSKERVLRAEDSKRGSTYDVRKPVGWIPPDSEGILAKWSA